jgi:hypothetical protein
MNDDSDIRLFPQIVMDHKDILVSTFIKRAIIKNLEKLDKSNPNYTFIKKGGGLLWNQYYRFVYYKIETLDSANKRLQNDLQKDNTDTQLMNVYITTYGPLL